MKTQNIIFYKKYFDIAEELTNEQFGRVVKAIGRHFINDDKNAAEELSDKEKMLYMVMQPEIKANLDKYAKTCRERKTTRRKDALVNKGDKGDNNKNKNNNKNNNNNNNKNKNSPSGEFAEIERLELQRRLGK